MEVVDKKISYYFTNGILDIENTMTDYRNYIQAIIKRICTNLSNEDIEEIYIEVFFALWQNQNKLDINKSMSSYLRGITRNLITHKIREIKNIDDILECEEQVVSNFDIEDTLIWQDKKKIISNELKCLKAKEKDIFILYYYQNKSIDEISKLCNLSKSNIKIILFRIRKKIKKGLIKGGYDYNGL